MTMIHYAVSLFYEYPSEMFMECMLRLRHLPSTLVKEAVYSTYEKYLWLLQVFREYIYSDPKLEALTEKRTQELLDEINKVKSESMKEKKLGEEDEAFINWLREAEHLEEKDIEIYKL
ncbi:hypothetical protein GTO27_03825, partial [Candidatus Bathyarchaeota archaeon]|nr:hypothetical protein [Candidatus Bathyarchaeota archaeon]